MEDRIRDNAKGCREAKDRKKGIFRIYFSLGKDPETGKYLRTKKKTVHCKSKNPKNWDKELERALEAYRLELESGNAQSDSPRTISDYADTFHLMRKETMGSPLAYEREGYDVRHIRELFGDTRLKSLRPGDIRQAYAVARANKRFSESELHRIHVKLSQIMDAAVADEFIDRNPCASISVPMPRDITRKAPPQEDLIRLHHCLLDEQLGPQVVAVLLILNLGLRKGEALGLTWKNYDTETGVARIIQQYTNDKTLRRPKSLASNRLVTVPDNLRGYLALWKVTQAIILEKYGLAQCEDTPLAHSISLEKANGENRAAVTHMDGHNLSRWFRDLCVDNGFGTYQTITNEFVRNDKKHIRGTGYEGLCLHQLRHAQATYLIGAGADIKTVQARLGHASPNTTLAIYSHAIKANDQKAADTFETLLRQS